MVYLVFSHICYDIYHCNLLRQLKESQKKGLKVETHIDNAYLERSFSPSMVVIKSIICPDAV